MLRAALCSKLQIRLQIHLIQDWVRRSYEVIHLLTKLVEQECRTEGEVYASIGVMSDLFLLTGPARSQCESMVFSVCHLRDDRTRVV